jgi:hypothetical protein
MSISIIVFTFEAEDNSAYATIVGYTSLDTGQTMAIATVTLFDQVTPSIYTEIRSQPTILCAGTNIIVGQQYVNGKPHGPKTKSIGNVVWDGVHINKPTAFQFNVGAPMQMQSTSPVIEEVPASSLPNNGNYTGCKITEKFTGMNLNGKVCVSPIHIVLLLLIILLIWFCVSQK